MVVYTWWCWHICLGEEVGVVVDQLREEKKVFRCTPNYRMILGLEYYFDPLLFGSNIHVGCVALWVSFPKYPRSSNSEFGAKSYSHFSVERSVTKLYDLRVWSAPSSPVSVSFLCRSDRMLGESGQWWPDTSGHQKSSLEPLWKWPEARRVESGHRIKVSPVSCAEICW